MASWPSSPSHSLTMHPEESPPRATATTKDTREARNMIETVPWYANLRRFFMKSSRPQEPNDSASGRSSAGSDVGACPLSRLCVPERGEPREQALELERLKHALELGERCVGERPGERPRL